MSGFPKVSGNLYVLRKPSPSNSYPPNSPTKNTCQELKQSIQNLTGQPTPHPKVPNPKKSGLQLQPLQYFSPGDLYGCFPKKVVPQNGWFIMENPFFKREDLGENPLFSETPIYTLKGWLGWLLGFISHWSTLRVAAVMCLHTFGPPSSPPKAWAVAVFNEGFLMIGKRSNFCP